MRAPTSSRLRRTFPSVASSSRRTVHRSDAKPSDCASDRIWPRRSDGDEAEAGEVIEKGHGAHRTVGRRNVPRGRKERQSGRDDLPRRLHLHLAHERVQSRRIRNMRRRSSGYDVRSPLLIGATCWPPQASPCSACGETPSRPKARARLRTPGPSPLERALDEQLAHDFQVNGITGRIEERLDDHARAFGRSGARGAGSAPLLRPGPLDHAGQQLRGLPRPQRLVQRLEVDLHRDRQQRGGGSRPHGPAQPPACPDGGERRLPAAPHVGQPLPREFGRPVRQLVRLRLPGTGG